MLDRRVQILLDEQRYARVAREARKRGTSIASVIREAIDRLDADDDRRRQAFEALLAAEPMQVPWDPADLRKELDDAHDRVPD